MTNTEVVPGSAQEEALVKGWAGDRFGPYQFEIRCGMCGGVFYGDEATKTQIATAAEAGFDNPFLCDECDQEYDDLAHEH